MQPPRIIPAATLAVGALLGVWFALAPLDEVTRGMGRIVPQARTQVIQHLEGGIVQEILVREGSTVAAGQPLFRLRDNSARSAREEQVIGATALLFKKLRLEAEQANLASLNLPEAEAAENPELADAERELFAARRDDFRRQGQIVQDQIRQKQLQIQDVRRQLENLTQERTTAQRQLEINTGLHAKGALSETRLLESRAQLQALESRSGQLEGQIPVFQAALAELNSRYNQLADERQSRIADELSGVNAQLQQFTEREKSLGERLDRTTVVAPVNGVVNRLLVTTVGGVVQPAQPLAELTPTDGLLEVEGRISARDRARVWSGQSVTVRVSAYDYSAEGTLTGTVRDISADSLRDEQGQVYYRIGIELPQTPAISGKPLLAGMTVDFFTRGERRSPLWHVTEPLRRIFNY